MAVTFSLSALKRTAAQRPVGFVDAVLSRGIITDDHVQLDASAVTELRELFPDPVARQPAQQLIAAPDTTISTNVPGVEGFKIDAIKAASIRRPPGYMEFVLSRGKIEGNVVMLDKTTLREIRQKFPPLAPTNLSEPSVAEMAANFTSAMADWVKSGFVVVERQVYEQRHSTCLGCEFWDAAARGGLGKCRKCGCSRVKLWLKSSRCPLHPPKW